MGQAACGRTRTTVDTARYCHPGGVTVKRRKHLAHMLVAAQHDLSQTGGS
jgi:hypothetical protein